MPWACRMRGRRKGRVKRKMQRVKRKGWDVAAVADVAGGG